MLKKYFPNIREQQLQQFEALPALYFKWNEKINVVSRKDIENIEERHVLHSLAIAKVIEFQENTKILDIGTGGGFPGIPLAIMLPNSHFHLVDSIEKKIKVVSAIVAELGLQNVKTSVLRVENLSEKYDFVVNRAVKPLPTIISWTKKLSPKGIICLKGGELSDELKFLENKTTVFNISDFFEEVFFETKKVVFYKS
jgi:16S rRNA (guanine527-N7)-methyltransferase